MKETLSIFNACAWLFIFIRVLSMAEPIPPAGVAIVTGMTVGAILLAVMVCKDEYERLS